MKIEILENGNILIEKNNTYYLITRFRIRGTFIENYAIYEDIYGDIDLLKNASIKEETGYYVGEYATLEEALLYIYKECN